MSNRFDALIVGGGQAGAQAALMLRRNGFVGTIAIVSQEHEAPYERPPLSKEYLLGEKSFDAMLVQSIEGWRQNNVVLILGERVVSLDHCEQCVITEAGRVIGYTALIWAAGGAARKLACAGADLEGVHTIRSRSDVDRLLKDLPLVRDAVVIGGGYIGLEAAAALTKLGKRVTLVEAFDRVLARVAGEPLSRFFEQEHRDRGVDIMLNTQVAAIEGANRVTGVVPSDGAGIAADIVIVGIGIAPEIDPLREAGAEIANGVRVGPTCRTSLPNIYAIGDCAEHRNRFADGAWIRLESVQNANDQAAVAAKAMCGIDAPYVALPWFWSNQYDLRLQTVGLSAGCDDIVLRGAAAARSFSIIYLRDGRVIALDCVNAVRDYTHGRALVLAGATPPRQLLADTSKPLKTLLTS